MNPYPPTLKGILLATVDHTWSLPNTLLGYILALIYLATGNTLNRELTYHTGAFHFQRSPIPGYLLTVGTTIAGVYPPAHRHEHGHVMQARIFGPLYLPLVAAHYIILIFCPYWLLYHDYANLPIKSVSDYFLNGVYRHVWHEVWAYKRFN